ncbi:MAG: V-type ATP synthase subunit F [Verrucomicrobia bacterium]|nr:V-type ATP synthase subunit F [Verrucomicrobiota bacterium]
MRLQVIGHQDAVWGFALVGVPGCIVTTAEELHAALDAALADATVGIIMVTDDVAALARERIETLKVQPAPLLIEIPGPAGPRPDTLSVSATLQRTLGVKI